MKPEEWNQTDELFQQALNLAPDERAAFLNRTCDGKEHLRQQVESLLAHHEQSDSFLEPPGEIAAEFLTSERSCFQEGQFIGRFQVIQSVGAGGMGEVYRARDSRLGRDVALKVLPPHFSEDAERVRCSEREAKLLAFLNHPNIAAIYDTQESDGLRYLVLEFVEGQTLAKRLKRGRLALAEALEIGLQIAEALEAAHEQGIVHRDLKPGNIMLSDNGRVKVLDFGIAKMLEPQTDADARTNADGANFGVVLGTPSYMSPEQARGNPVDKRTDIWAFGCVLYEVLSGHPAFQGETTTDTLAAIVEREPNWAAVPSTTPVRIQELLHRCLQKDHRQRLRDIGEARIKIEEARREPASSGEVTQVREGHKRLAWSVVAMVVLAIASAFAAGLVRIESDGPKAETSAIRFNIFPPEKAAFVSSGGVQAISPDGTKLVFIATDTEGQGRRLLWVRPLDSITAQPLEGTEGAAYPFWSPDSHSIGFFAQGNLKRVEASGGPPRTLCNVTSSFVRSIKSGEAPDVIGEAAGGAWSRDGTILFGATRGPLYRAAASGNGPALPVTVMDKYSKVVGHEFPYFLPDGRHFLYAASFLDGRQETALYPRLRSTVLAGSLESKDLQVPVLGVNTPLIYAPGGYLLFLSEGTLMAQQFDLKKFQVVSEPVPIAVGFRNESNDAARISVSETGAMSYRTGRNLGSDRLAWFDRNGKQLDTAGDFADYVSSPALSADGKRVAVARGESGSSDIWVLEWERGITTRFTANPAVDTFPIWSPDGTQIAFSSTRFGFMDLFLKSSSGGGQDQLFLRSNERKQPLDWSSDSRFLLYQKTNFASGAPNSDLWVLPMTEDRLPIPFLETKFNEAQGQFSPDTRFIAYTSDESGAAEVYVQPFPRTGAKWQVSTAGGATPRWNRNGKELFYRAGDGKLMSVMVRSNGPTFETEVPKPLFQAPTNQYTVSPDGQRFLFVTIGQNPTSAPITVVLNWTAGFNKK